MKILGLKPSHDGAIALIDGDKLEWSYESEKDSHPRYASISSEVIISALEACPSSPDVIAISGWHRGATPYSDQLGAGYFGDASNLCCVSQSSLFGKPVRIFNTTHERTHLMCSYGLSPFVGSSCYALIWEGHIGAFYEVAGDGSTKRIGDVVPRIGDKYLFLYHLAAQSPYFSLGGAGKLMALAAYGRKDYQDQSFEAAYEIIMADADTAKANYENFRHLEFYKCGVEEARFRDFARYFTDRLFSTFLEFARAHLTKKLPLVIGGGCGLNCEWNAAWAESSIFSDVFVPPCTNDSGSALGAAIDAKRFFGGSCSLDWTVYCGQQFVMDVTPKEELFEEKNASPEYIAQLLAEDKILAWVDGCCEMGPRALGHRSLLAAPFNRSIHTRLNSIKKREDYRPIAPLCLPEAFGEHFEGVANEHMLFLAHVRSPHLRAVTHVDGTARVQVLRPRDNARLTSVLRMFKEKTKCGVLCNTSLNFNGRGFINRMSDLQSYSLATKLDGFVVENRLWVAR